LASCIEVLSNPVQENKRRDGTRVSRPQNNVKIGTKTAVSRLGSSGQEIRDGRERGRMSPAETYRRYAAECLALAQKASTPEDRAHLLQMAQHWRQLAEKADAQGQPTG
jgi:hypothetical protein